MYDRHESKELGRVYKGYQGQDPALAKLIFLGTDANFADDIELTPIFEEVIEYLSDGVEYWKRTGWHHPFLSPAYNKGSGYRYHYQFNKLGLSSNDADKVSFVELLKCPTFGNKTSYRRLMELLDVDYLAKLDADLSLPGDKAIYIARGVFAKLYDIGQRISCFRWLPKPRKFERNVLYDMGNHGNLKIYVVTHFSDALSNKHLAEIRRSVRSNLAGEEPKPAES